MRFVIPSFLVLLLATLPAATEALTACGGERAGADASALDPATATGADAGCLASLVDLEDVWIIPTTPGERIEVEVSGEGCEHLVATLHHAGQELSYGEGRACPPVRVQAVAPAAELLLSIRLPPGYEGVSPTPAARYTLAVAWGAVPACGATQDDAASGRDAEWNAPVTIGPGTITLCLDRWDTADVFRGPVAAGEQIEVADAGCSGAWLALHAPAADSSSRGGECGTVVGVTAHRDGNFKLSVGSEREGTVTLTVTRGAMPRACAPQDDAGSGGDARQSAKVALPDGASQGCLDLYDDHDHFTLTKAAHERLVLRGDAGCADYHFVLTQPGGLVRAWDRSENCQEAVLVEWSSYSGPLHLHVDRLAGEGTYTVQLERIAAP